MSLSPEEQQQYSRHLILEEIGEKGQLLLKKAKVLVIGAGGLSCPVIQYLSAAGIGTIGIIDDDKIEQHNLQRQILFSHNDLGKYKAEIAAVKMKRLNPFIEFKTYTERLDKNNALDLFREYDIVVDGSDNFPTRYLVNDAAVLTSKALVFASIFKFEGQVSVLNYKGGPTYRCLYPTPPSPEDVPNCSDIGVLGVLPGIIGAMQANEVIKIVCNLEGILSGKLLNFDALSMQSHVLSFDKNEEIQITNLKTDYEVFCGVKPAPTEITWQEFQADRSNYELLDVRTSTERAKNSLGGVHIPLDQLILKKKWLPKGENIVVYCQSGQRSKRAIEILKENGVKKYFLNLKDGISSIN